MGIFLASKKKSNAITIILIFHVFFSWTVFYYCLPNSTYPFSYLFLSQLSLSVHFLPFLAGRESLWSIESFLNFNQPALFTSIRNFSYSSSALPWDQPVAFLTSPWGRINSTQNPLWCFILKVGSVVYFYLSPLPCRAWLSVRAIWTMGYIPFCCYLSGSVWKEEAQRRDFKWAKWMREERSQNINNRDFAVVKWGTVIRWKLINIFNVYQRWLVMG